MNKIADYDKVKAIFDGKAIEYDKQFNLFTKSLFSTFMIEIHEFKACQEYQQFKCLSYF
ncbi:unnamed protein product [Paramecium primaurelia]|uniref:Uncharacterized protein n=1 Tax=Paramecium primaurelia TaxID=5886 RepID=A0A8S1N330_PARPR|nr:unnamed protein product [Paramecium primaurelia]